MFLLLAFILIPCGTAIILVSLSVQELKIDYTDCQSVELLEGDAPCHKISSENKPCVCQYKFEALKDEGMDPYVFVYYGLTNYYQNHHKYRESVSEEQLGGDLYAETTAKCTPYHKSDSDLGVRLTIAPCGAVANSLFNDTFNLYRDGVEVPVTQHGIGWVADSFIFGGPAGPEFFANTSKPPAWPKGPGELSSDPTQQGEFTVTYSFCSTLIYGAIVDVMYRILTVIVSSRIRQRALSRLDADNCPARVPQNVGQDRLDAGLPIQSWLAQGQLYTRH